MQVKSLEEIISKQEKLEEDDHSNEFLASFYENACLMMYNLTEKIKSIEIEYSELIKYFADSSKEISLEMFIEIFNKFYKDLLVNTFVNFSLLKQLILEIKSSKKRWKKRKLLIKIKFFVLYLFIIYKILLE